jgi:hypothetical protein
MRLREAKARGVCPSCYKVNDTNLSYCSVCRDRINARDRKKREQCKLLGNCYGHPNRKARPGYVLCDVCIERMRSKNARHYDGRPWKDYSGTTIHNWIVHGPTGTKNANGKYLWNVECSHCAAKVVRVIDDCEPGCFFCRLDGKGNSGFRRFLKQMGQNSAGRGYELTLTEEEIRSLSSSNCYYCDSPPSSVCRASTKGRDAWGDYYYNGIDRMDNAKGYIAGNVVPCCGICNRAKLGSSFERYMAYRQQFATAVLQRRLADVRYDETNQ